MQQSVATVDRPAGAADDRAMDLQARRWARISVAAGAVVLLLALASALVPAAKPCGGLPKRYPPIIAFELARDGHDLEALFGDRPGPCRTAMVSAMDTANVVDLAAFIPAYALFLAAWFLSRRGGAAGAARLGVGVVVAAAVCDVLENVCLLALTPEIDPASPWLGRLAWITGGKWLGLAGAAVVAAAILVRGRGWARVGAAACLLSPVAVVAALIAPPTFGPVVSLGVALAWIACLVDGARRVR